MVQMQRQARPATTSATQTSASSHDPAHAHVEVARHSEPECGGLRQETGQEASALEERSLASEVQWLHKEWEAYQHQHCDLPPELLPFEKLAEQESFHGFLRRKAAVSVGSKALAAFTEYIRHTASSSMRVFEAIKSRLPRTQEGVREALRGLVRGSRLSKILRTCSVALAPPAIGSPAEEALRSASRLIRDKWCDSVTRTEQGVLSVHRWGSKSVLQIGSGSHGCIYITVEDNLDPVDFAMRSLSAIIGELKGLFHSNSVVTVYDGDLGELNPKHILTSHRVVRCVRDDLGGVRQRLAGILTATAPCPVNTNLHIGVPASPEELAAVFDQKHDQEWGAWDNVARAWEQRSLRRGFGDGLEASSDRVIQSLTTQRNVIIVVAHAEGQTIHLPAPPPEGSRIGPDELEQHREAISANSPFVYLFACETAQISDMQSFAEKLLECGAAAVVAPQTKIGAISSADLFESFVGSDDEPGDALLRLQSAEESTNYREMEVWIG